MKLDNYFAKPSRPRNADPERLAEITARNTKPQLDDLALKRLAFGRFNLAFKRRKATRAELPYQLWLRAVNSISGFLIRLYAQCAGDRADLTNHGSFSAFSKRISAAKEAAGFLFGGIAEIFDALGASCRDQILFKNIADLKQALIMKTLQQGKLRRM